MKKIPVLLLGYICSQLFAADFYVDVGVTAGGDGTSSSPFADIQSAIDAADKGDTIKLKGNLFVSDLSQCVIIPETKTELTLTNWGEERFSLEVDNAFISTIFGTVASGTNIITVCAQSNTISGIDFVYHKDSLGLQNKTKARFIHVGAKYTTIRDCSFYKPVNELPGYGGASDIIQSSDGDSEYLTVERCCFENIFGSRGDYNRNPISVRHNATVRNCVFKNCWGMLTNAKYNEIFNDYVIVSNIYFLAKADSSNYSRYDGEHAGIFFCAFGGMGSGEIAHNIFIDSTTNHSVFCYRTWQGFREATIRFHHNTVMGLSCLLSGGSAKQCGYEQMKLQVFDNILNTATVFFENSTKTDTEKTHISAGSFMQNNVLCLTNNNLIATGKATECETYKLFENLGVSDNIFLDSAPVFIETDDISSADFFRPRERDNPSWIGKGKYAWTNEGVYPDFIGAVEPEYSVKGFTVKIR